MKLFSSFFSAEVGSFIILPKLSWKNNVFVFFFSRQQNLKHLILARQISDFYTVVK